MWIWRLEDGVEGEAGAAEKDQADEAASAVEAVSPSRTYQEMLLFVVEGDGVCVPGTDYTGSSATGAFNPVQIAPGDEQVTDSHISKTARNAEVCVVMNGCQVAP